MLAFRLLAGRYKCACMPGVHIESAAANDQWGCHRDADFPVFPDPITGSWTDSRYNLHRCPAEHVGPDFEHVISVWRVFGGGDMPGPLPVAGGWLDQTQWFADAHSILFAERAKLLAAKK